jgi:biopolymer transport protein ExbD
MNMPQKNGKRKVQAPRIDLTPMVDLGFLLITFFIFTTTMAQPKTMEVNMPYKANEAITSIPGEGTITLIPTKEHTVAYYNGSFSTETIRRQARTDEIREILLARPKAVATLPATFSAEAHKLHVVIKPHDDCTYEDVVSLLDEMSILQVPYYAIDEITVEEKDWIKK